jgi:hypothetical protein
MEMVVAGEARTFMLVSMCVANWRAGRVSARHIEGLSRSPQIFIRESKLSVSRAPTVVSQVVKSVVQDLTESGSWPTRLHAE